MNRIDHTIMINFVVKACFSFLAANPSLFLDISHFGAQNLRNVARKTIITINSLITHQS